MKIDEINRAIEECKKGNHELLSVSVNRHSWDESDAVARWCQNCGAVVVDTDFDGRTSAGDVMPMRFPVLLRTICGTNLD